MNLSLTVGPLSPEDMARAMAALASAGITGMAGGAQMQVPARPGPAAPPPMPAGAPPPPPQPAAPPAQGNAKLDAVLRAMDTYSRAGHGVAGARKVLAVLGLSRAQDANDEQLDWLVQAFGNTAWAP